MKLCNVVGCPCEGTNDARAIHAASGCGAHRETRKAYEFGFTYYAASYYQRYSEPNGVYISLVPGKAEEAAAAGAEYEREELKGECGMDGCTDCHMCNPDVVAGQEFTYRVKDLFSAAELREHRRALLRGEVVYLSR